MNWIWMLSTSLMGKIQKKNLKITKSLVMAVSTYAKVFFSIFDPGSEVANWNGSEKCQRLVKVLQSMCAATKLCNAQTLCTWKNIAKVCLSHSFVCCIAILVSTLIHYGVCHFFKMAFSLQFCLPRLIFYPSYDWNIHIILFIIC